MKKTLEMPDVNGCSVSECTYNVHSKCHARAITIGDGDTPHCDTLFCNSHHVQGTRINAGVGACKVGKCSFNEDMECTAERIDVGVVGQDVMCMTFSE